MDESHIVLVLNMQVKDHFQIQRRGIYGPSNNKFGWESNSVDIDSRVGRVSTHRAMENLVLSNMPKENDPNDKNPFSFLMKYFYNPHKVP